MTEQTQPTDAGIEAAGAGEPFGYFHQLLDHEGKGNGVWLGAAKREVVERAHVPGETSDEVVALYTTPQPTQAQAGAVPLTVRLTSFPESNGKRNWTALLVRKEKWDGLIGNCGGISLARGELWNRVAYKAECARFLIGERDTEPFILDYGDDITTPDDWAGERGRKRHLKGADHG
jgi:hypothetical protein